MNVPFVSIEANSLVIYLRAPDSEELRERIFINTQDTYILVINEALSSIVSSIHIKIIFVYSRSKLFIYDTRLFVLFPKQSNENDPKKIPSDVFAPPDSRI